MRYLITTILILTGFILHSQELSYKQFTGKDGLPGSVVYQALQDKKGFIWFATKQGVSCFDGHTFRNYTKEEGLPDNDIIKLYLDKYDNVWCISFVGIPAVFHDGVIKRFDDCTGVTAITEDLLTDSIHLIAEIRNPQNFFQGSYTSSNHPGKWKFTGRFEEGRPYAVTSRPVLRASSPEKINFWFAVNNQHTFSLYIGNGSSTQQHQTTRGTQSQMSFSGTYSFFCLTADKKGIIFNIDGTLYYGTPQKMVTITSLTALGLKLWNDINSLFCENDSTLWVCTRSKGLLRISHFLTKDYYIQSFFEKSFCTAILKDQEQGYWITTQGDGVYYLPNLYFYSFTAWPDIHDKNALCIGRSSGTAITAGFANGHFIEIDPVNISSKRFDAWATQNKNNRVLHIQPLQPHTFLLACDKGLYRYASGNITKIDTTAAKEMYYVSDTMLFLGTSAGVSLFNRTRKAKKIIFPSRITCLTGLGTQIYMGTLQGVYTWRQGTVHDLGKQYPALAGIINHLDIAPDSSLWASTQQGIMILKNGAIISVGKAQGMLSNLCKHVSFEDNTAWVATDKGIARISYQWQGGQFRYSISNITEEDGLASNEVNQTVPAGNYVWAATAEGISWFPRDYTSRSAFRPLINITKIIAGGQTLQVADTIRINQQVQQLTIELSGISYRSGKQIRYEYRLNGDDSNWSSTTNNVIEFSALPTGQFSFEVLAIDKWGVRSYHPARLVIIHPPPFWQTIWFLAGTYLVMALLLSVGFYLYHRRRQRKQEAAYHLKKKMHELEMMALRAQMNPHFIFNCLASIQYHIMRADIRGAHIYLHKFSTLIRQILQYSTHPTIPLREEIKLLELYLELEKLRLGDRMDYQLRVSADVKPDEYSIPTMIIQPHVENAIKHGIAALQHRKGILAIDIRKTGECIEVIIDDNGPGITHADNSDTTDNDDHVSMGASITTNRINAINAIQKNKIIWRVSDKQQAGLPGSGTIVYLSFPLIFS